MASSISDPNIREKAGHEPAVHVQAFPSHSECQHIIPENVEISRKLKWKLDLYILPLISSVYFFAAMGRSDMANAKIAGMEEELQLSPKDYSNAATAFLVAYVIFQLPGTLLIKKIGPPIQFSGAMMIWGAVTALSVLIHNVGQLFAIRFLVGSAEAFVQGGVFYLSFWYEYRELATRGAIFYSMSTIAGAFNGLIAFAISNNLDGANGWRAWRWIFLVEGVAPAAFSSVVLALLPASPSKVRWGFTATEKQELVERSERAHNTSEAKLEVKKVPVILLSPHFWLFCIINCAGHFCLSSMSNFLPDIIEGFGFDTIQTQLFTVIVYACACIGILFWSRVADRTNRRGLTLAASTVGAVVGYAVLIAATDRSIRFAFTCILAFSIYPHVVLVLSWAAMSFVGYTRRGSALAFLNIFSQLFAISGNQAYNDPPYYRKGNSAALGMVIVVFVGSLVLSWYLGHMNNKRKAAGVQHADHLSEHSIEELGDRHPNFVYTT